VTSSLWARFFRKRCSWKRPGACCPGTNSLSFREKICAVGGFKSGWPHRYVCLFPAVLSVHLAPSAQPGRQILSAASERKYRAVAGFADLYRRKHTPPPDAGEIARRMCSMQSWGGQQVRPAGRSGSRVLPYVQIDRPPANDRSIAAPVYWKMIGAADLVASARFFNDAPLLNLGRIRSFCFCSMMAGPANPLDLAVEACHAGRQASRRSKFEFAPRPA